MVVAWLYNVIDKNLHGSVAYAETAHAIWTDLEECNSQGNSIRIHQLKREITLVEQGSLSVTDYFTKLKSFWDELGTYQVMPRCTCGCKCRATKEIARIMEEEIAHKFLMGLDPMKYNTVRSAILNMEPLPSLNKAYAALVREETNLRRFF
uniref:Uncharacterized protein n=1 Tax=Opuntia streptacantha TaxID=393608 RepID=A0A7C9AQ24_OPUST